MTSTTESTNMSSTSESKIILKPKVDCSICADEVSQSKIVKCQFCGFDACRSCIKRFLLGIDDDRPRCMSPDCKKVWTYEFLSSNFPSNFHNKKYRDRRATLLYEREKSLLPGTQPLVAAEKENLKKKAKIKVLLDENAMLHELIRLNNKKISEISRNHAVEEKKEEQTVFTRACPAENCRGFLSKSLKCGTCEGYACKHCQLPKKSRHDEEHKCDPDLVATVKLLANDTKQCPACATPIYKIQGCDQMYCTQCHTAFSWERGTIERGVIHNPHFYEFQRAQNNGVAPARHAALRCGGPPEVWEINEKLDESNIEFPNLENAHRLINHINIVELANYPNRIGDMDNSTLRVDYLMNRVTEDQLIAKLKSKMKKQEKNSEFNMVLSMYTTTMSDLFGNITTCNPDDIPVHIATMNELREYTNRSLKKIGLNYENIYPVISDDYRFWPNSKTAGKEKKIRGTTMLFPIRHDYDYDD